MNFITNLIAKYFGKTFITRAVTSIVALVVGYLSGAGLDLAPEVLDQFGESFGQILTATLGLLVTLFVDKKFAKPEFVDKKFAKPETPKIVK